MTVPRAQLRIFSPLETFPVADRERWRSYVEAGGGLTRREVADAEDGAATARLLTGRSTLGPDAALIRRMGTRTLLCPLQLELRSAIALEEFRRSVPPAAFDAFVPDRRAAGRLADLAGSGRAPHILDEPWTVPLHWFVAFSPSDRRVTDPPEGAGPRLRYLTSCERAASRLEHVIEVVEEHTEDGEDVLAILADLAVWVDAFDQSSILELDYGGVGRTMTREQLESDRTCEDLWRAVEALEEGDALSVAAAYGSAVSRWRAHRAKQHAS